MTETQTTHSGVHLQCLGFPTEERKTSEFENRYSLFCRVNNVRASVLFVPQKCKKRLLLKRTRWSST